MAASHAPKTLRGLFFMFVAGIFFFAMSLIVKSLDHFSAYQLIFFRAWVALLASWAWLRHRKISLLGNNRKKLFIRGVFGTIALILFFFTLHHLPMATAVVLQYLSPIFTTILAALFLSEKVRPTQWLCFATAFAGVLLIRWQGGEEVSSLWIGLGIVSALCSASAYTMIGSLKDSEETLVIVSYLPLVTVPIVAGPALINWVPPTALEWGVLIGLGFIVQTAQYFMTLSYQIGPASTVSIVSYVGLIYAAAAGFFLFDEQLSTNGILGMSMIVLAVITNSYIGSKR